MRRRERALALIDSDELDFSQSVLACLALDVGARRICWNTQSLHGKRPKIKVVTMRAALVGRTGAAIAPF